MAYTRFDMLEVVLNAAFKERPRARVIRFSREELQRFAAIHNIIYPLKWWSGVLQDYRMREGRYRLVAQGYGTKATWRAIAKSGAPAVHRLRQSQEHHLYIVQDAILREARDLNHEVLRALEDNNASQSDIRYRINEFEVSATHRLVAAGVTRDAALLWLEPTMDEIRARFIA